MVTVVVDAVAEDQEEEEEKEVVVEEDNPVDVEVLAVELPLKPTEYFQFKILN
jgi:hypothetical protein